MCIFFQIQKVQKRCSQVKLHPRMRALFTQTQKVNHNLQKTQQPQVSLPNLWLMMLENFRWWTKSVEHINIVQQKWNIIWLLDYWNIPVINALACQSFCYFVSKNVQPKAHSSATVLALKKLRFLFLKWSEIKCRWLALNSNYTPKLCKQTSNLKQSIFKGMLYRIFLLQKKHV